jgi:ketopantoate hydroxymethyltransferase
MTTIMGKVIPIEQARERLRGGAMMCADLQLNLGHTPSAFLGTAATFGAASAVAFRVAHGIESTSPVRRLTKTSAIAAGVTASGLACMDVVTYAGHRIKGTNPDNEPTVIARALDTDLFQQKILDNKFLPVRLLGAGAIVSHAILQGALAPNDN